MAETPAGTPQNKAEPATVGDRLRTAREAAGLDLAEIAARTRIPQRHLEAIEQSDFSALPSPTYAYGFVKAYARSVGLDEVGLARTLRSTLSGAPAREPTISMGEIEEPSRLPSPAMTIGLIIGFLVLIIAAGLYYGGAMLRGGDSAETTSVADELGVKPAASVPIPAAAPAAAPPATDGPVVLTAKGEVWLRVYDAANQTLVLRTFQAGERFEVPANANRPMINTGRPDLIDVTVGGRPVPALGTAERAIKDVEISGAALLARAAGTPAAAPASAPATPAQPRTTGRTSRPAQPAGTAAATPAPASPTPAATETVEPVPGGE
ncbi:helix-turn-helix domain-containing protein [Sphingomonas sp. BGYR3]|uniref:helix-turn-helix domain-containing protein n=1 Tax=Sphingomonas sp. BGYR3 TaxID=2975483 RepID=UPI0021A27F73|nr:helix-turn-helix domain-containing protein [Sphingomonas sp. BGYR3]MDG5489106.1 helix-turn-helix domain-containing protein [Sphingomonas sp. BGYR3]